MVRLGHTIIWAEHEIDKTAYLLSLKFPSWYIGYQIPPFAQPGDEVVFFAHEKKPSRLPGYMEHLNTKFCPMYHNGRIVLFYPTTEMNLNGFVWENIHERETV